MFTRSLRPRTSFRSSHFYNPLDKRIMKTSGSVKDDILGSIQQYSEVKDLGYDLLKRQSHPDLDLSFKQLQAYIRQGLTFFGAAYQTHYRSSPLVYYYAFMNFAKAIVFLYDYHQFQSGKIYHGLTTPVPGSDNFRDHSIEVKTDGVFQKFYTKVLGEGVANTTLGILDLLSYISDLTHEFRTFKLGEFSTYPCKYAVVRWGEEEQEQEQHRGVIAAGVLGASPRRLEEILKNHFTEVNLERESAMEMFDLRFEEIRGFTFWETKDPYIMPIMPPNTNPETDLERALGNYFSQNPFADSFLFKINAKMRTGTLNQIPMNEPIAIYTLMFYFGSLVRYHPQILEEMLTKKEAQLIESFVRATPITFLRYVRNVLDGDYFAYTLR
jgi:hypothetical protein